MHIVWARPARTQLSNILEYVAERDAGAASRIAVEAEQRTKSLGMNPHLGRPGRIRGTRELVLIGLPYIVAYRVTDHVEILAVMHGAQLWPKRF